MRNSGEKHPALDLLGLDERGMSLPAARRSQIIRKTMAARRGSARKGLSAVDFLPVRLPAASWAAVLAFALLVVGAGYIWHPQSILPTTPSVPQASGGVDLSVTQVADAVVLEWADGGRETFTVRQASSARAVREAPGIQVRGRRFVDHSATDAPVVYYLVE